jgi:hypothetical protein
VAKKQIARRARSAPQLTAGGELGDIRLLYPALMDCNFERWDEPDKTQEPERFYDLGLRPVDLDGTIEHSYSKNFSIATCLCAAGLRLKDKKVFEVTATYLIAFDCVSSRNVGEDEARRFLEQIAQSATWPLFRALFIHIGSQSGFELPLLVNVPRTRWFGPDDDDDTSHAET